MNILRMLEQTISLEEVQSAIKAKELQRKLEGQETSGESYSVRGRHEKKDSNKFKKSRSKSRNGKSGKVKPQKGKLKCFHCHKEGHFKRDCPEKVKKDQNKERGKEPGEASLAEEDYESSEALAVTQQDSRREWILDSGCSFHMTPNKDWFESLQMSHEGSVLLGNNKSCPVLGKGSVRIKMFDGIERMLNEVRYIPELKRNLISLGMLDKSGYSFKAENGYIKVAKGSCIVMKGMMQNGIYSLLGSTVIGGISNVTSADMDKAKLWHMRLGHVSERGLQELSKQDLLCGDKIERLHVCEQCIL